MTPLLFLSGAGLPAWIWDDVRARLDADSRVAPRPSGEAPLSAYVDRALEAAQGWESFHVVAHSIGGVVGCGIVARAPERVAGFVGVSAIIPAADQSFVGALPFPQRLVLSLVMRVAGTRPPDKALRNGLAKGLPEDQADRIVKEFEPESQRLYRDKVGARSLPAHTSYLLTTQDSDFPVGLQEKYAARLGDPVVERVATGHLPMIERPDAAADAIGRLLA